MKKIKNNKKNTIRENILALICKKYLKKFKILHLDNLTRNANRQINNILIKTNKKFLQKLNTLN